MGDVETSASNTEKEYASFLSRDFSECFAQMRHYDGQIIEICKFAFGAYTTAIAGALALYKYGLESKTDYRLAAGAILGVALLLGIVMLSLVITNRVYFVMVARYVNEHRKFFLSGKPLGFPNATRMYDRPDRPLFFDWRSSQSLQLYVLALLNAVLGGLLTFFFAANNGALLIFASSFGLLIVQLAWVVIYLRRRDNKTALQSPGLGSH